MYPLPQRRSILKDMAHLTPVPPIDNSSPWPEPPSAPLLPQPYTPTNKRLPPRLHPGGMQVSTPPHQHCPLLSDLPASSSSRLSENVCTLCCSSTSLVPYQPTHPHLLKCLAKSGPKLISLHGSRTILGSLCVRLQKGLLHVLQVRYKRRTDCF